MARMTPIDTLATPRSAAEIIAAARCEPCRPWPRHVLTAESWATLATALAEDTSPELLAMWADTATVHALFRDVDPEKFLLASVRVTDGAYPALSPARPAAAWFERAIADLFGHRAEGGRDGRPWLDHGRWAITAPLSPKPPPRHGPPDLPEYLTVDSEEVHQIPVGPVHAGIIEPGHFRFHVSGETVVRLEARLGYVHKGTLGLMRGKSPRAAARFAARLSGDSTVAHSVAFARAAEAATGTEAPPRADALRGVMGELERVANHLGDIGAIANDAGFTPLLAQCGQLREAVLRASAAAFGHRLMMDAVIPGGIVADLAAAGAPAILRALDRIDAELPDIVRVWEDTASLVDRMTTTGITRPALVAAFAPGGYVGRAAGRAFDVRRSPGYPPYGAMSLEPAVRPEGDVDARAHVRMAELAASSRMIREWLAALPAGPISVPLPMASGEGIGWAEGFRGDIWHWLRLDGGLIASAMMRDPSWLQWPLLEAAIEGNIVADFPLINKSFNCSYSGVDL
jgi:Ni,Fe-hydrogenase III large subunit